MVILYILGAIALIVLQYFIAKQFEAVARDKGYADSKYFHMCFWLGMIGYLLVIALPDRGDGTITTVDSKPAKKNAVVPTTESEQKVGQCQLCGKPANLTHCKIEDDLGTRYRDICSECVDKLNATQA